MWSIILLANHVFIHISYLFVWTIDHFYAIFSYNFSLFNEKIQVVKIANEIMKKDLILI